MQLYVKRLDDPGAFKKCTTVSFDVMGECTSQICELYLFRKGRDGWKPETVVVYDYNYPPVIFNYNICLTKGRGIGYNYCGQGSNQISSIPKIKACSLNWDRTILILNLVFCILKSKSFDFDLINMIEIELTASIYWLRPISVHQV